MDKNPVTVGGRRLDGTRPPLLVAELSGNHNGSLDTAIRIVNAAAESGAAALKLQTFRRDTLTIDSRRPEFFIDDPGGLWHGRRLWELYEEAHTPWEWHEPIIKAARRAGLLCLSTACDETSLEFMLDLDLDAIKISSFELVHLPLIDAAARSGRPLFVSTGMGSLGEIDDAVTVMKAHAECRFILLKCTSAYPSIEEDANVLSIPFMKSQYGCEIGLSDHALQPHVAYAATALGAVVVEKHLTLSRAAGGVDAAFSLEPAEMRTLADGLERVWKSLGHQSLGVSERESASVLERPSVYVVEDVAAGQIFSAANLRVIRPGAGLPPKTLASILGRRACRDVVAGTPMSWEFVSDTEGGQTAGDTQ